MFCPTCGAESAHGDQFCGTCGAAAHPDVAFDAEPSEDLNSNSVSLLGDAPRRLPPGRVLVVAIAALAVIAFGWWFVAGPSDTDQGQAFLGEWASVENPRDSIVITTSGARFLIVGQSDGFSLEADLQDGRLITDPFFGARAELELRGNTTLLLHSPNGTDEYWKVEEPAP